ncbi:YybH family protein [Paraburkholderia terrae]|uniref:YybH family protein n=1 Tax=Paraburkholderia terrae TaxID=311230 RepID=UPI00296B5256|nr:nuclear transport factor 2 family protein [Paraburkholderia terrae]MDW3656034.1 nuclear transport factor 2 family protein [Paraburkholderia terrae]
MLLRTWFVPVLFAASVALPDAALAAPLSDTDRAITQQLHRYEQGLNASDTNAIMSLYDDAPVVMAQYAPPAVGREAVRDAYTHAFSAVRLNVRFSIDEIKALSPDWAFARTRSTGTIETLTGKRSTQPDANQELFILHRGADGVWRIARYGFSTTNPPAV